MHIEEKARLKALLKASVFLYLVSIILLKFYFEPLLTSYKYLGFLVNYPWVSWALTFIGIMWMPVSLFLFIQGIILANSMSKFDDLEKAWIPILSIVVPICFWITYIGFRILN